MGQNQSKPQGKKISDVSVHSVGIEYVGQKDTNKKKKEKECLTTSALF